MDPRRITVLIEIDGLEEYKQLLEKLQKQLKDVEDIIEQLNKMESEQVNEIIDHLCECIKQTDDNYEKVRLVDALSKLITSRARAFRDLNDC